jgi:O-antigen/teichoic acid export membrane protein
MNIKFNRSLGQYIFTFFTSVVQAISSLVVNKILAVYSGPLGLFYYSQFQSFFGMIGTVGSGSMGKGIMSISAERYDSNVSHLNSGVKSAIQITSVTVFILILFLCLFSTQISKYLFNLKDEKYVIYAIAFNLLFYSFNSIYISLINGTRNFPVFNVIRIIQNLLLIVFVSVGTLILGWRGAIYLTVVTHFLVFFIITLYYLPKIGLGFRGIIASKSNMEDKRLLLSFTGSSVISIIVLTVSQIYIRNTTASALDINTAGYFEALLKLTTSVIGIFWGVFSVHYLPEIAKSLRLMEFITLIKSFIVKMIVSTLIIGLLLIMFGSVIIKLLYNNDFLIIKEWIVQQMFSEIIRVIAWCLGSVILVKKYIFTFGILDIVFSVFSMLFVGYFIETFGILGRVYLQTAISGVYSLMCVIIILKIYKNVSATS